MNTDLYEQFVTLKDSGKKADAKEVLDLFIASFQTPEGIRDWVFRFLESGDYGHRIRHEIYEKLVYPVLLNGYLENDVCSIEWLAKTFSNLVCLKSRHKLLEDKCPFTLYREAFTLGPNKENKAYVLNQLIRWFQFAEHEWPDYLIWGTDDTIEEYEDLLNEVDFARSLDDQNEHEYFLFQFEAKVNEYIRRLQEHT